MGIQAVRLEISVSGRDNVLAYRHFNQIVFLWGHNVLGCLDGYNVLEYSLMLTFSALVMFL